MNNSRIQADDRILFLSADEASEWFLPPDLEDKVQLVQIDEKRAHALVLVPGVYYVGRISGGKLNGWIAIVREKEVAPTPVAPSHLRAIVGKAWKWVVSKLPSKSAMGTFAVSALLLVAGAVVTQGLKNGCSFPNPFNPTPTPSPGEDFKVGFFIESKDALTESQKESIYGGDVRDYLETKAKDWRIFDKDVAPSDPFWKSVFDRPRTKIPWVYIQTGKGSPYEGEFPAGKMIDLLKKYGG